MPFRRCLKLDEGCLGNISPQISGRVTIWLMPDCGCLHSTSSQVTSRDMANFFTRQHGQRTASVIVFLSSAAWGIMWVPVRYAEAVGLPPLWVQLLFVLSPESSWCRCNGMFSCDAASLAHLYSCWVFIAAGLACFSLGLLYGAGQQNDSTILSHTDWVTLMGRIFLGERSFARWNAILAALFGGCLVMQVNPVNVDFEPVDLPVFSQACSGRVVRLFLPISAS